MDPASSNLITLLHKVLRWIGYVERMDRYRMAGIVWMTDVGQVRSRPMLDWMDSVKVALGGRGMMVEAVTMRER